ncbi:outer membrane protein assembly factor BamE domain-containing protein [Rickettsiales endosymbiont of Stachyamoeba lipophora]|uniref:outer membrane protein assembly factor BamE domain-containing protein n=1 Tax=Rickettsiales endosymbiont of Stachyamoeba lipophora TaxID=2486578 RepID=UPI000F654049|nr:outer membrane protein assembly factor BamE [Rickettsiales endosymbiont of Stachyamoeba lipophora]AZL16145.1 outer membrane protein assembly factor BamE [Rickettsiales endosymbiont of Stachyamoeba lipophora]
MNKLYLIILTTILSSCLTREVSKGHTEILDNEVVDMLKQRLNDKELSKEDIVSALGSPEVVTTMQQEQWFYLSTQNKAKSFLTPKIVESHAVIITFKDNKAVDIEKISNQEIHNISYATGKTPTKGDDDNVLKEIFGNLGRFNVNRNTARK